MTEQKAETVAQNKAQTGPKYMEILPTERLRAYFIGLNKRGLSQEKLAEMAGVTQGAISSWIRGESNLSAAAIDSLCRANKINLFLMDGSVSGGEDRPLKSLTDVFLPSGVESAHEVMAARNYALEMKAENDRLRTELAKASEVLKAMRNLSQQAKTIGQNI